MTGRIDRVVVTLDTASENAAAINTAVRLAARAKAPLHGVFLEDEDLLALANSPVVRQVTFGAGAPPHSSESIELHLKMEAGRARQELFEAAKRDHVKCTFEVVRGAPAVAVAGASERDLVVAGALGRLIAGHFRLECRWWSSIGPVSGSLLLARHMSDIGGRIVVLLRSCEETAARLLDISAQIAEATGGVLTVLYPPEVSDQDLFEKWLADRLEGHSVTLHAEVASAEMAALQQRIQELGCHLLAIEGSEVDARATQFRDLVASQFCDVLIVR